MDDNSVVTKADMNTLRADLKIAFDNIHNALKKMHDDLVRADDEILSVLIHMDKRLTVKTENHEREIGILKRQVA